MALLRHRQGSITRVLPHAGNRNVIIPRRSLYSEHDIIDTTTSEERITRTTTVGPDATFMTAIMHLEPQANADQRLVSFRGSGFGNAQWRLGTRTSGRFEFVSVDDASVVDIAAVTSTGQYSAGQRFHLLWSWRSSDGRTQCYVDNTAAPLSGGPTFGTGDDIEYSAMEECSLFALTPQTGGGSFFYTGLCGLFMLYNDVAVDWSQASNRAKVFDTSDPTVHRDPRTYGFGTPIVAIGGYQPLSAWNTPTFWGSVKSGWSSSGGFVDAT